ncbi:alternative ribosome rescue aminoacyl-tRNA hydrolase ArfB [Aurantimonas sp. VKM B-3413]|uniref:alternative ribosome rescue aminoacyl-tRNA hydrolase ArfB n=1 Tax=Aurantimonas sp. VKM B-3413 TaxID=2779401 RepID=UPI001E396360|nr:alternative ribosome rescue aminoacyl-tRNA hydrolase ArfB [Aurantimonas sp. VKM B-3413]MCB8837325.1 aminoacyl-tRNA hydrolase [Aurantimonas sp. VKM B-3413]
MADDNDLRITERIVLPANDLEEQFIRAGGPGGQNVNKVSSAVQLRYRAAASEALSPEATRRLLRLAGRRATKEGEILIEASRFRSQDRNREDARERLAELVREALKPPPPPRKKTRPSKGSVERRLKAKKGRGQIKKMRGNIAD